VFGEELEQALKIITALPGAGAPYVQSPVPGVRRFYLRKVGAHLYYTFDDTQVIIRALWSARRGRPPQLDR
jgi:plasmid stabilization system protein ParE